MDHHVRERDMMETRNYPKVHPSEIIRRAADQTFHFLRDWLEQGKGSKTGIVVDEFQNIKKSRGEYKPYPTRETPVVPKISLERK